MKKSNKIRYISAFEGGIEMMGDPGQKLAYATDARMIAGFIKVFGLEQTVHGSSSIDFADEYGFKTSDGALKLWNEAIDIVNFEVNGVA